MTSSLVGSEMCIRDRPLPRPAAGGQCRQAPHVAAIGPGDPRVAPEQKAVSYTHLTLPTICSV
eukprot:2791571-Prorocentrum_lima.AAC.1